MSNDTIEMLDQGAKSRAATARAVDSNEGSFRARNAAAETVQEMNLTKDEAVLAKFGKKQQLKRRFKSLSTVGLTSGLMLTWEVVLFTLQFGLGNGGPTALSWGYLGAWVGAMLQAAVMAEIASMIPLAGGAFNWVAVLSPPSCRTFLSYIAGWLSVISWQVFVAEVCFTCASLIQGVVILTIDSYEPQLWHATLIFYAIMAFGLFVNTFLGRILPRIESLLLIFYIIGFFGVMIPLVYLSPKRTASDVFRTFLNFNGWQPNGLAFFIGWITSVSSFVGADGSDHIAEEVENAATVVPFSIWFATLLNGGFGFGIMLAVLFVTPDYEAALDSPTGFPFMDIFVSALGSFEGASALIIIITAINVFSISSVMATTSRVLWAFARERGLPGSKFLVKVDPKSRLPYNAIITTIAVNTILALISIGSTAAFQAFYSVEVAAYYSTFLVAACCLLYKRLTTPDAEIPWGPFKLGRLGVPITVLAILYTIVVVFFSFWPATNPTTAATMNYSVLIYGASGILMLGFWFFQGRERYTGPIWEFDGEYVRNA